MGLTAGIVANDVTVRMRRDVIIRMEHVTTRVHAALDGKVAAAIPEVRAGLGKITF